MKHTLQNNVLMGLPVDDKTLLEAIQTAVLEQDIAELEKGMETVIGPRGVKLSGGQVQRTAAARMFVRNPELFVFDDLSSALDVETENTLWERIFARQNATCIVVSHRKAAIQIVTKNRKGQVIPDPSVSFFFTTPVSRQPSFIANITGKIELEVFAQSQHILCLPPLT